MAIDGKKDVTITATEMAVGDNLGYCTDSAYLGEVLYRKPTGEFFLYAPLTEETAREWVECHAREKYDEIFADNNG